VQSTDGQLYPTRRDAKTISARILTGIVRLDFALLLIAAWLAAIGVGARL
jgi:hypothetical protein